MNIISLCGEQLAQFPSSLVIWTTQAVIQEDLSYFSLFDFIK